MTTKRLLFGVFSFFITACGGTGGGTAPIQTPASCATGCSAGFSCQAGSCQPVATAQWTLTLASGSISERKADGSAWDVPGGLPDPFVCLTLNGQRLCSSVARDTLQPSWDEDLGQATTTSLRAGVLVEILDQDLVNDDLICGAAVLPIRDESLRLGRWDLGCTSAQITFALRAK